MAVRTTAFRAARLALVLLGPLAGAGLLLITLRPPALSPAREAAPTYAPRAAVDTSGYGIMNQEMTPWKPDAPLSVIADSARKVAPQQIKRADALLAGHQSPGDRVDTLLYKAGCLLSMGEPAKAYAVLEDARRTVESDPAVARRSLYSVIYFQGVAGLRQGETANCVRCRGASACIIPFDRAAVHRLPEGSRRAVRHFTEYLRQFPEDTEIRWLLNMAHTTLGEYPDKVDPRFLIPLDQFAHSEMDIGRFHDIGSQIGLERENEGGGAVMDDFDNDGLLDIVVNCFDPTQSMGFFRNQGDGRFEDVTAKAGLTGELGGPNLVQGDYNNDGFVDLFVTRGAWLNRPIRPSLLRNNGNGTFSNVTEQAGVMHPANSIAAQWADYDNDGFLDLFVCVEGGASHLYHNERNGKFKDVAGGAGLLGTSETTCKGAAWIDYDGDDYADLFLNYLDGAAHLFHNDGDGHFSDETAVMGINGPRKGFSCWAWDYDNDGWPDLFATCYERTLAEVVKGIQRRPTQMETSRLFHNDGGRRFQDVTRVAGLDQVFSTMGSNFGDFDNDGFLDLYLATGEPNLITLVPNRMFRNVAGGRFTEITGTSGTGHLQKGHGVACGDWDRDGNVDLFVEMGGAVPGDRYHNALFQNPGHQNGWVTVKLIGRKTNRSAIGARIKAVTAGPQPQTFYRWVSSGSSFGGNPLQQTIGLGPSQPIATLEIHWPASHTTQVFHDLPANQALEITEQEVKPRVLPWRPLSSPAASPVATPKH